MRWGTSRFPGWCCIRTVRAKMMMTMTGTDPRVSKSLILLGFFFAIAKTLKTLLLPTKYLESMRKAASDRGGLFVPTSILADSTAKHANYGRVFVSWNQ